MIRRAKADDRAALEALYDICFPGEPGFRVWFFDRVWRPENTLVWEESGGLPSAVQVIPMALGLGGEAFASHYIYAAGTRPDFRGRGIMGRLLDRAFEDGTAAGQDFSCLITENDSLFAFYRPFGYECIARVGRFSSKASPPPRGLTVRPAAEGDTEAIMRIYRAETRKTLAVERNDDYFRLMRELYEENFKVLCDESGDIKAYCFTEKRQQDVFVSEAMGPMAGILAAVAGNQTGGETVFQGIAGEGGVSMGCIKPLTPRGAKALESLEGAPYINILFN